MADCERALGNPDKALALVKEGLKAQPEFTARVELRLVEAGARALPLGFAAEGLHGVEVLGPVRIFGLGPGQAVQRQQPLARHPGRLA